MFWNKKTHNNEVLTAEISQKILTVDDLAQCLYEQFEKTDKLQQQIDRDYDDKINITALKTEINTQSAIIKQLKREKERAELKVERTEQLLKELEERYQQQKSSVGILKAHNISLAKDLDEAKIRIDVKSNNEMLNAIISQLSAKTKPIGKNQMIAMLKDMIVFEPSAKDKKEKVGGERDGDCLSRDKIPEIEECKECENCSYDCKYYNNKFKK